MQMIQLLDIQDTAAYVMDVTCRKMTAEPGRLRVDASGMGKSAFVSRLLGIMPDRVTTVSRAIQCLQLSAATSHRIFIAYKNVIPTSTIVGPIKNNIRKIVLLALPA